MKISGIKVSTYEIAMVEKSQTEMKISPWLFHLTFKNKLFTDEKRD